MANRTLRRSYIGTVPNTEPDSNADGSIAIGVENESGTVNGTDTATVNDGANDERDVDSVSSIGSVEIDPDKLGEYIANDSRGNDNGEPRKRRKRGPNKRTTGAKKAQDSVEPFLLMAHTWAAVFLKTPELALEKEEAKQLSDAYSTFCEYHDIPILSPKRMSEINMIAALCLVYGPRFVAVRNRKREEKAAKPAATSSTAT